MKLLLPIVFMGFFAHLHAQSIRIPASNSSDPKTAFSRFFVTCEGASSRFVELTILTDEGQHISQNNTQHLFKSGKNTVSFSLFFDQLLFNDSFYENYFMEYGVLPPGGYQMVWTIGEKQKKQFIEVKPEKFELEISRIFGLEEDSIDVSWSLERPNLEMATTELKWSYLGNSTVEVLKIKMGTDTILSSAPFLEKRPIQLWVEHSCYSGLFAVSETALVIPKSKNIPKPGTPQFSGPLALRDSLLNRRPSTWNYIEQNSTVYGSIGLDFFGTTNDFSYNYYGQTSASMYGNIGLDFKGIPIKGNFLVNHFQNTGFQVADISFDLDVDRLKRNLQAKLQKEIESQQQELLAYPKLTADFDTLEGGHLQRQLSSLKENERFDELKQMRQEYEKQLKDSVLSVKEETTSVYRDSIALLQRSLKDSMLNNVPDMEQHTPIPPMEYQNELDSFERLQRQLEGKYKSFLKLEAQYQELKNKGIDIYRNTPGNLDDPALLGAYLPEKLKKYGNVLLNLKKLEMGWTHARFSDFTLADKALQGLNFEYQNQIAAVHLVSGTTNNGFIRPQLGQAVPSNTHSVDGLSIGLANNKSSSVRLHYVEFKDRNDPLNFHAENRVLALSAKQSVYKGIGITGEIAQSYSQHANTIGLRPANESALTALLDFSNTTSRAYSIGMEYLVPKTSSQYSVALKRIGSGFQTLGNPFLYNDRMGVHVNFRQGIMNNRLMLIAQYAHEINNLSQQFADTATFRRFQLGVVARLFRKINFSTFYLPVSSQFSGAENMVHTVNSALDFNDKIGSVKTTCQVNYALQISSFEQAEASTQTTEVIGLNTLFISRQGSQLRIGGNMNTSRSLFKQQRANASFNFKLTKAIRPEVYTDYYNTTLFGNKLLAGGGIRYQNARNLQAHLRCAYSSIQRPAIDQTSSGLETSFTINVGF